MFDLDSSEVRVLGSLVEKEITTPEYYPMSLNALLNACMILAGMGPMGELHSTAGKLFASGYALFSGLVFIVVMGVVLTPLLHRILHAFHLEQRDENEEDEKK